MLITLIESTYAALSAAFAAWSALSDPDPEANNRTLYQRIELGRAYMPTHPGDARGVGLLAELEARAKAAEIGYYVANSEYKRVCDGEATK